MPGRVRPPEEIARLSAAAKAMRRGGATQIEIARALNVPGSTIARWAGEGGWRVCDMAAEMPPLESAQLPDLPETQAEAAPDLPDFDPSGTPQDAARSLLTRAMTATQAGQVAQGERLIRMAERLSRLAGLMSPAPGEEEDEPSLEEMRAELNDRLNRIRASFTVEQMEAFAHENGGIMTETEKENHRAYRREYGYKD